MTGIPILDTILDLIMQYRLGIAMMGLAEHAHPSKYQPIRPPVDIGVAVATGD